MSLVGLFCWLCKDLPNLPRVSHSSRLRSIGWLLLGRARPFGSFGTWLSCWSIGQLFACKLPFWDKLGPIYLLLDLVITWGPHCYFRHRNCSPNARLFRFQSGPLLRTHMKVRRVFLLLQLKEWCGRPTKGSVALLPKNLLHFSISFAVDALEMSNGY